MFRTQVTMDTLGQALIDAAASAEARMIAEEEQQEEDVDIENSSPPHKRHKQSDEVTYTRTTI